MRAEQENVIEAESAPVTPMDTFWLDTARNAAKESVGALEEAAKQLVAITSLSQGIYFAAISFGDVKKALVVQGLAGWAIVIVLVIPFLFWIASLAFAILVFKPETYRTNLNSPDLARETYREIVAYKHRMLRKAHVALVLGFVPLVVNVVVYLALVPKP